MDCTPALEIDWCRAAWRTALSEAGPVAGPSPGHAAARGMDALDPRRAGAMAGRFAAQEWQEYEAVS